MSSMVYGGSVSSLLAGIEMNKSVHRALRVLVRLYGRGKLRRALERMVALEVTGHDQLHAALRQIWEEIYGNPERGGMAKLAVVLLQIRRSR